MNNRNSIAPLPLIIALVVPLLSQTAFADEDEPQPEGGMAQTMNRPPQSNSPSASATLDDSQHKSQE